MNQDYMDSEILADFFIEAREHLESIEPNLLELEQNPSNLGLLTEIFRPMHSLKGASGFLGLNLINRLAHKAENILDELRNGSMSVTSEIMDLILAATDALRSMVDNLEESGSEGDVDIEDIVARIGVLLEGGDAATPATPEPPVESTAAPVPEDSQPEPEIVVEQVREPVISQEENIVSKPKANPNFDATPYSLTTVGEGHLSDFLEEAHDIIENLNSSLLTLEGEDHDGGETVNDIFRYYHNLKGNSGIIGFRELNSLTHEAETLLNRVRKGEIAVSQGLIDLLLQVVDLIESLVNNVDSASGKVTPIDTFAIESSLKAATTEGGVPSSGDAGKKAVEQEAPAEEPAEENAGVADFDPEDVSIFVETVNQQLDNLHISFKELKEDASQSEYVDGLFRSMKAIQNSAGYMGFDELSTLAERTAGLVDQARKSGTDFGIMLDLLEQEISILSDRVFKEIDQLGGGDSEGAKASAQEEKQEPKEAVEPQPVPAPEAAPEPVAVAASKQPAAPKPPIAKAPAPVAPPVAKVAAKSSPPAKPVQDAPAIQTVKQKISTTIRVEHQKLDHLMNLIGELIINRNRYSMLAKALEGETEDVQVVAQQLTETTYAMARLSDDLQDTIMKVRMVPVQTVFSRFPRLVRDLSRKSGKQVDLIMEGEETELDKSVVEEIGDPLVHLVRNAVDHGLESEEERLAAGKPAKGHVWLRAYHKGNSVAIEVEDDGKGIDPEKMREVAVRKGVITAEEARNLDDREAIELIFAPGFSSAEKVTDISGRGVGMDVVKTNIKNLKGSVHTASEKGKGTKLTLTLPLTLAIIDALMVEIGSETYAIPLDAVSETTKIEIEKLSEVNNCKAVTLRGEVLGIVELSELLELPMNTEERDILPVVVIHDHDRRLGLVVDKLLERQEIVIKPLGQYLDEYDLPGLSGATIMGDGSVVLILDPHEIYSLASSLEKGASTQPQVA